ncbi:hypothetical protein E1301_Tti020264 [Triplophysa tibetana]|uniref:Uncharacterized protein n=1 Tax=Triplophysa tibetana TaxID=1572043 RepID=A0A5A9NJI2_9TELE|nr:hypothetical protein E1301_Tti020264 [Triplophysa tibetana]
MDSDLCPQSLISLSSAQRRGLIYHRTNATGQWAFDEIVGGIRSDKSTSIHAAVNKVTTEGLQEGERGQRVLNTTRHHRIRHHRSLAGTRSSLKLKTQTADFVIMEFGGFEEAVKISPLTPRAESLPLQHRPRRQKPLQPL